MKKFKDLVMESQGFKKSRPKMTNTEAPAKLVTALDNAGYQKYMKVAPAWAKPAEEDGCIETLEGPMNYKKGDYLCVGPNGDRWPCYKDVFEATYELVEG